MKSLFLLFLLCSLSYSIKIQIYWNSTNTSASPEQQQWFQTVLWPPVEKWFQESLPSLSVNMTQNLTLASFKKTDWACSNNTIPPELNSSIGVATEYYHIIRINDTGSYDGFTTTCIRDKTGIFGLIGRPLVGESRFSISKFVQPSASSTDPEYLYDKQISTILHELTHALVFQNGHFFWFLDPNFKTPTKINYNPIINKTEGNKTLSFLNATSITSYLRAWHQNSHLPGLALEDQDLGTGTHVNMRVYPLETMTYSAFAEQRITNITMHVYNSSGWYIVDFFYAEPSNWAHNADPDDDTLMYRFGDSSVPPTFEPSYVSVVSAKGNCSYTGRHKNAVAIELHDYKPLALMGPFVTQGDCWNMSTPNTSVEIFSPQSRCFEGNFPGYSTNNKGFCLRIECLVASRTLKVYLQGNSTIPGAWYVCPSNGVAQTPFGTVKCPYVYDYCNNFGDGYWGNGVDYCVRGCMGGFGGNCKFLNYELNYRCVCNEGFVGADCSIDKSLFNPYTN